MNFTEIVTTYVAGNIILSVAFVLLLAVVWTLKLFSRSLAPKTELNLHYFALLAVFGLMMTHPFLPKRDIFKPVAKVWAAPSRKAFHQTLGHDGGYISVASRMQSAPVNVVDGIGLAIIGLVALIGVLKLIVDLRRLRQMRSRSYLIRWIGDIRIYASRDISVPFSFWWPGQKNAVIPESMLDRPEYRLSVLHEFQHHRQGDTKWVYVLWLLKLIFILNPAVYLWGRWVSEDQELACDDALLTSRRVDSTAYARCLLQVAANALAKERPLVSATGVTFLIGRKTLKRRIKSMLEKDKNKLHWRAAFSIAAFLAVVLGVTAYAAQGFIQDRRVSLSQAQSMASAMPKDGFPIVVNDRVVKWLNYFTGTPDGREQVKSALQRMVNYRPDVEAKLNQYGAPEELTALPLIESGYKNLDPGQNRNQSAGLWQFIPKTARNFGLHVNSSVDQRMNVPLETDAAMRYLLSNKLRFDDWQLSILAYNGGEKTVQSAINQTGSRDAWNLIRSGLLSQETDEYLPKFMAAVLIMRNPQLAE